MASSRPIDDATVSTTEPGYYSSSHPWRALVLTVSSSCDHAGAKKDTNKVLKFLNKLGSIGSVALGCVSVHKTTGWDQTFEKLDELSKELGPEPVDKYSGLICFVLCRGFDCNPDSERLEKIWTPFCIPECQLLIGKPKLFFVEAYKDAKKKKKKKKRNNKQTTSSTVPMMTSSANPGVAAGPSNIAAPVVHPDGKRPLFADTCVSLCVLANGGGDVTMEEDAASVTPFVEAMLSALRDCIRKNDGSAEEAGRNDLEYLLQTVNRHLEERTGGKQMIQSSDTTTSKLRLFAPNSLHPPATRQQRGVFVFLMTSVWRRIFPRR